MVNLLEEEIPSVVGPLPSGGDLLSGRKANKDILSVFLFLEVKFIDISFGPFDGIAAIEFCKEGLIGTKFLDDFCGAFAVDEDGFNDIKGLGVF